MVEGCGFNLQYVTVAGPNMPVWEGLQRQSSEGLSQKFVQNLVILETCVSIVCEHTFVLSQLRVCCRHLTSLPL